MRRPTTKRVIPSLLFSLTLRSRINIPVFSQTKKKREKKFTIHVINKITQIRVLSLSRSEAPRVKNAIRIR